MKKSYLLLPLCFISLCTLAQIKKQSDWQQQVSYQIKASLNDKDHILNSSLELWYKNNSPDTLTYIYMHIWPNAYSNDKTAFAKQQLEQGSTEFYYSKPEDRGSVSGLNFRDETGALKWEFTADHIDIAKVILNKPLLPGASVTISTDFVLKIPQVFSRLGHDGQDYYMTQWYPKPAVYDVNGWNPMPYLDQGEFYSEFGSFDVIITLPKNYIIAATGELQTEDEQKFREERIHDRLKADGGSIESSEEMKTVRFTVDKVHDFAWFASKYFNIARSSVSIEGREIQMFVYGKEYEPKYLNSIETALEYYSKRVGPYPYSHASVVAGSLKAGAGMEYPMITVCGVMGEDVIIHEVGHNWFYGVLANNERLYPWMDEAINSFYDDGGKVTKNVQDQMEQTVYDVYFNDANMHSEAQPINTSAYDFTEPNIGVIVYGIGSRCFLYLEQYLGVAKYDSAMRHYYETWKFRHPLPDDMKQSFEESTSEDLSWFFDELLGTTKKLDYGIKSKDGKPVLYNNGEINAPIPIVYPVFGKAKTTWFRLEPGEEMVLEIGKSPRELRIDQMEITTDLNSNNDVVGFRPVFQFGTGKDKKGKSELYAIPALGWNGHDRLMVGALLHNYSFSDKKTQYYLIPLYSTGQKTVSGIAALNHHIGLSGPGAGLDINLQAKKFSWSQDGIHSFSYTKIKPSVSYDLARSSHRSLKFNSISLQYHYIDFNPLFDLETDRRESFNENYLSIDNWQFLVLEYRHKNKKAINPYSLTVEFEQGITSNLIYRGMRDTLINGMDTIISMPLTGPPQKDQSTHTKLSAIFEYNLDIGIKKKPLRFRAYMSYFINTPDHGYFYHRISNAGITRDYRFDELVMYRGADTGLFAQQISSRKEHSKFVSTIGQSDRMLANLNISIPIPGKIPIRAYLELMTFTDIDKSGFNASGASLIYNFGLELTIIPTVLTVYINLAQNSDVSNWQDQVWRSRTGNSGDDGFPFVNKITFRLDLRNLTPTELKKSINLF